MLLNFQQVAQPFVSAGLRIGNLLTFGFIQPVRGNPAFGHVMHRLRAYLNFQGLAVRPDQHCVQGLIPVCLGDGDVVFEPARHRFEQIVGHAQRTVAFIHAAGDNAVSVNIEHFGEGQMLRMHFLVNAK